MKMLPIGMQLLPVLRRVLLGVTSASLLLTTTLTPVVAQGFVRDAAPRVVSGPIANTYSVEELEAILAPVALYPDQLLTQLLMAAAFPDQVAAAARWAQGNRNLRGEALDRALRQIPWDPAVKSLVPFPSVLDMLASHAEWTAQLAYAVAEQEPALFDAVQRLRRKAWQAGQLRSTDQQVVRVDGDLIVIEPGSANMVYVPIYQPQVVYGPWAYPAYPPYYFSPPYFVPGDLIVTGIYFGVGVVVVGSLWGWARPHWHDRRFYVDHNRYEYFRHFHRAPPGDWGRWERNHWRPPASPYDGQFRPPPPPPGDGQFRPPPPRPHDGQFRPPPPRPGDGQFRPPPPRPHDGQFRPPPPRPHDGQFRPPPASPHDGQFRPPPPRPGDGQFRPPPHEGGNRFRAPQGGRGGVDRQHPDH